MQQDVGQDRDGRAALDDARHMTERAKQLTTFDHQAHGSSRITDIGEVAALVELLTLGQSGFVSGQVIPISGAWC